MTQREKGKCEDQLKHPLLWTAVEWRIDYNFTPFTSEGSFSFFRVLTPIHLWSAVSVECNTKPAFNILQMKRIFN